MGVFAFSTSKGQAYLSRFSLLAKLQSYNLLSFGDDKIEYDSYAQNENVILINKFKFKKYSMLCVSYTNFKIRSSRNSALCKTRG